MLSPIPPTGSYSIVVLSLPGHISKRGKPRKDIHRGKVEFFSLSPFLKGFESFPDQVLNELKGGRGHSTEVIPSPFCGISSDCCLRDYCISLYS